MRQSALTATIAALSFALGISVARLPLPSRAATAPLAPVAVDLTTIGPDAMPTPSATFPDLHSKTLAVTDGMTLSWQIGTAPRHYHADADELQVVVAGTGTEWLGSQRVTLKPGTLVIVPKGTAHAGLTATAGPLEFVSIKTPPQDPADVHFLP